MPNDSSTNNRWFESAVQFVIFYSIGSYFIEAEFADSTYFKPGSPFWLRSERVIGTFFTFEYVVRWMRAKHRGRYPFSGLALIDLFAILPFYIGLAVDLRALRLVRTLRILRLFKLYRYNTALQNVLLGFRRVKTELAVVGFVVVIMIMSSSVAMYEFEHDAQPEKFRRLSDAVWWSFVTLTTVGYGDLYPITAGGRVIAIGTMVVGIGIVGTFISLIGSSFMSTMREEERHLHHHHYHHNFPRRKMHRPGQAERTDPPWIDSNL